MWDLLAIVAASILLLDVAARRIAFDPARVRVLARRAVGRRADITTETVAAWKRTRANVSHPRRRGKAAANGPTPPGPQSRFEATDEDAAIAIDVGEAGSADARPKAAGPRRAEPEPSGAPDEAGETAIDLISAAMPMVHNRAGFRRVVDGEQLFYVFPQIFKDEICKGLDNKRSIELCLERKWLVPTLNKKGKKTRSDKLIRINKNFRLWMYAFNSSVLGDGDEVSEE